MMNPARDRVKAKNVSQRHSYGTFIVLIPKCIAIFALLQEYNLTNEGTLKKGITCTREKTKKSLLHIYCITLPEH